MKITHCPKCHSKKFHKRGFLYGRQRYCCNVCGCKFTTMKKRGYSDTLKEQAIHMSIEGMGMRAIGRVLGIHNTTVLKWIRQKSNSVTVSFPPRG